MLKHTPASTHTRVTRGDQVPGTPPLIAKIVGIPTMEELSNSPDLNKRNDLTFTLSQNGKSRAEVKIDNIKPAIPSKPLLNGQIPKISNGIVNHGNRPVSVHGNLINNQSIYANTMMVPRINGASSTGKGLSPTNENDTPTKISATATPTTTTSCSIGTNLNTSYNALLNNSRLSSSNSPSTNGTKTTGMDSSRENPHDDFDFSTRVSPPTTTPNGCNVNLSRSSSHRHAQVERPGVSFPPTAHKAEQQLNLSSFHNQFQTIQMPSVSQNPNQTPQIPTTHIFNTTNPQMRPTFDVLSPPGERSFNYPHNSTIAPHSNTCSSHLDKSHNQSRSTSNSFCNTSFIPTRNMNNRRVANMTAGSAGPMSGYGGKLKMINSSLMPENVSKFMQMSKEIGVKDAITSLGLLCLVSLLLALLSGVFLLKLSPVTEEKRREMYRFNLLSATEYVAVYEVTLGMCALALSLNLCCILVSSIQFILAVKLVKSSPVHGRLRTIKYLHEAAGTRTCAIGGFFVSIPAFLTGIILYTFLHFDSTPAIITSIVIGLAIVFCGGAVLHNVFLWRKEIQNNRSSDSSNGSTGRRGEGDGEPALPMSPILKRVLDHNRRNNYEKYHQKSYVDLPHATLDLSGGGLCGKGLKSNNTTAQSVDGRRTSLERAALELSTLV